MSRLGELRFRMGVEVLCSDRGQEALSHPAYLWLCKRENILKLQIALLAWRDIALLTLHGLNAVGLWLTVITVAWTVAMAVYTYRIEPWLQRRNAQPIETLPPVPAEPHVAIRLAQQLGLDCPCPRCLIAFDKRRPAHAPPTQLPVLEFA